VHKWSPEVTVDEPLARRLLCQFPRLRLDVLRCIGEGWDNTVWLVDEQWTFRFPRRQIAIPGVEREIALLPALAPHLPLPVPAPCFVGTPADGYPWPFFGARYLPGRELCDVAPSASARAKLAAPLAAFLRGLHSVGLPTAAELPADPNRRSDMPYRVAGIREALAEAEQLGLWRAPSSVASLLDRASTLPAAEPTVVAHGDLHFRHLLLDTNAELTGVIDWGDVCRADPAIDLSLVWSLFPPSVRSAFLAAYGPLTDDQLLRARVLAFSLGLMLALYAHHEGLRAVERQAVEGLDQATID
jgi:aminoglycoside phosphotransferase (APT) family kinase protein